MEQTGRGGFLLYPGDLVSTALALIGLGYLRDAKKVLDGSIVEGEFVWCLLEMVEVRA